MVDVRRFLTLCAAVLAGLLAFTAAPAGAHSDTGEMTVLMAEQTDSGAVRIEVGIVYSNDDHLAEDATVSVTFSGSGGPSLTAPVTLELISGGRYGADVDLAPGTWEAHIASIDPEASATATVVVADESTTTSAAPTTTAPATTTVPDEVTQQPDEGTSGTTVALIAGAAVLAVLVVTAVVLSRRRSSGA